MRICLLLFTLFISVIHAKAQPGCTDPKATNYNASATSNNGSCAYAATTLPLTSPHDLPTTLNESSALSFTGGGLWTLEDSGNDPAIFRIDEADGTILQTVTVTNATNTDWEELTADDTYFYIGDFGNNVSGDRTDLKVYRILKSDIGNGASVNVTAETINFTYPDQVISGASPNNQTKFDCEAFFIKNGTLHLFTKDWLGGHTQHYSIPSTPGTYTATKLDEFDAQGLVTGASYGQNNEIVLVGYSTNLLDVFMWILSDYSGDNFFIGNRRKLDLGHSIDFGNRANDKGQIEGVTLTSSGNGYISSERIDRTIFSTQFIVPARLYSFNISSLVTLPVNLLSFKAIYTNPDVLLTWQTASEINSSFYTIQRSADAVTFTELVKQTAAGNSDHTLTYHYTDHHPLKGINYYRLKQVDIDGKEKTYFTRSAHVPFANALHVYPDAANRLVIDPGEKNSSPENTYQVLNITGAILLKGKLLNTRQYVDIATLPRGTYVLRVNSGESVQFIKQQ